MQHEERPYTPPAGASEAPTPQAASVAGPDQAEPPAVARAALVSEWDDTAMDAPCL